MSLSSFYLFISIISFQCTTLKKKLKNREQPHSTEISGHSSVNPEHWIEKTEDEPRKKSDVVKFLNDQLSCDSTEATAIYYNQQTLKYFNQLSKTQENIELLTKSGVSTQAIINNPYLLTMDISKSEIYIHVILKLELLIRSIFSIIKSVKH